MLLAHQLTWRVAPHEHTEVAHGYLRYAAVFFALAVAVVLVAATRQLVQTVGGHPGTIPSPWPFAVIPIVGFVLQEHLEHLVAARELDLAFFASPPFLVGLALQVPFACAALIVARVVVGAINTAVTVVRSAGIRWPWRFLVASPSAPLSTPAPERRWLLRSCAGRAPPLLA